MMNPFLGPSISTPKRSFARAIVLAGVLTLLPLLAACSSAAVGAAPELDPELPPELDPELDPAAITVFFDEAEAHLAGGSFVIGSDERASSGAYVVNEGRVAEGSQGVATASVWFTVAEAGDYSLWVRAFAPSTTGDAVYLGLGDRLERTFAPETGRYVWFEVARQNLQVGSQLIQIAPGEPGLRLDLIAVVRDPTVGSAELDELVRRDPEATPEPSVPPGTEPFSLRGDAGFDVGSLSEEQRVWHQRTLAATLASLSGMVSRASDDDVYHYGRELFQWSSAVLLGLRSSGDLRFLDALDPVFEEMRARLDDGWCGGVENSVYVNDRYGTVEGRDGFLNFRLRYDSGRDYCRDSGDLNEALVHGHLAMVMYAYHVNRDLPSPAGVDYGERADFWFGYLRDHFEAKWRERTGVVFPDMDFLDLKFAHTHHVFTLYYWFMGQRLASVGDADAGAYLARARELSDAMFEVPYVPGVQAGGFVEVAAPTGDAVVYSFGSPGRRDVPETTLEAAPMTYARYVMSAVLVLRLEGAARWGDEIMVRLSNGLTGFVIDRSSVSGPNDTLAAGVTGSRTVGGIPPTSGHERLTLYKLAESTIPAFAAWDESGEIEALAHATFDVLERDVDLPHAVALPASLLFVEVAKGAEYPAASR